MNPPTFSCGKEKAIGGFVFYKPYYAMERPLMYDLEAIRFATDLFSLVQHDTSLRKHATTNGGEWSGPCPWCGGTQRFHVQPFAHQGGRWFCRHCTDGLWQDCFDYIQRAHSCDFKRACEILAGKESLSPAEVQARILERNKRIAEEAVKVKALHEKLLAELQEGDAVLRYHSSLDCSTRAFWRARGVPDSMQDFWMLGYNADFCAWYKGTEGNWIEHASPTLTIPIYEQGWALQNIKHRLLKPMATGDRYRVEKKDLPARAFIANPERACGGRVLVVEGEIKAMVSFLTADDYDLQCIGLPSKNPDYAYLVGLLAQAELVTICLDPDAEGAAIKMVQTLGSDHCRLITLPSKVDDAINAGWISTAGLRNILEKSSRLTP